MTAIDYAVPGWEKSIDRSRTSWGGRWRLAIVNCFSFEWIGPDEPEISPLRLRSVPPPSPAAIRAGTGVKGRRQKRVAYFIASAT